MKGVGAWFGCLIHFLGSTQRNDCLNKKLGRVVAYFHLIMHLVGYKYTCQFPFYSSKPMSKTVEQVAKYAVCFPTNTT